MHAMVTQRNATQDNAKLEEKRYNKFHTIRQVTPFSAPSIPGRLPIRQANVGNVQ